MALTPATQRLTAALGASALLHAWLMQAAPGLPRIEVRRSPLAVTLRPLPARQAPLPVAEAASPVPPGGLPDTAVPSSALPHTATVDTAVPANTAKATRDAAAPATAADPVVAAITGGQRALSVPGDPTYYPAASLDVYPHSALPDLTPRLNATAPGEVRALVLIDEAGTVNDVRELHGINASAEAEAAARALLLAARFTPAQKDGHAVRAQVQVSLRYGAAP